MPSALSFPTGRTRTARAGALIDYFTSTTTVTLNPAGGGSPVASVRSGKGAVNNASISPGSYDYYFEEDLEEWAEVGGGIRYYEVQTARRYSFVPGGDPTTATARIPIILQFRVQAPKASPSGTDSSGTWSGADYTTVVAEMDYASYFKPYGGIDLGVSDPGATASGYNASAAYGTITATGDNDFVGAGRFFPIFNQSNYYIGYYLTAGSPSPHVNRSPYFWSPSYSIRTAFTLREIDATSNDPSLTVTKAWNDITPIQDDGPFPPIPLCTTEDFNASQDITWSGEEWAAFAGIDDYGSSVPFDSTAATAISDNKPTVPGSTPLLSESTRADSFNNPTGSYVVLPTFSPANLQSPDIAMNVMGLTSGYQFGFKPNGDVALSGTFTYSTPTVTNHAGNEVTFAAGDTVSVDLHLDAAYQNIGYRWLKYLIESDSGATITVVGAGFPAQTFTIPAGTPTTLTVDTANIGITQQPFDGRVGATHNEPSDLGIEATDATHIKFISVTGTHTPPAGVDVPEGQYLAYFGVNGRQSDGTYPLKIGGLVLMAGGVPSLIIDPSADIWTAATWTTDNPACGWTATAIGSTSPTIYTKEYAYFSYSTGSPSTTNVKVGWLNKSIPFIQPVDPSTGLTLDLLPTLNFVAFYRYAGDVIGGGDYGQTTEIFFEGATHHASFYTVVNGKQPSYTITTQSVPGQTGIGKGGDPGMPDRNVLRSNSDFFFTSAEITAMYATADVISPNVIEEVDSDTTGDLAAVSINPALDPYADTKHMPWELSDFIGFWYLWKGEKPDGELEHVTMDTSPSGRTIQAAVDSASGNIILRIPTAFGVAAWKDVDTGIVGNHPCARYNHQSAQGAIVLVYEDGSGAIVRRSTINERIFGVATTVSTTGERPALAVTQTGVEVFAWWDTNTIKVKSLSPTGNVVLATVTAVSSGVAEDSLALAVRLNGDLVLAYRDTTSGNITTVLSTDSGLTWA